MGQAGRGELHIAGDVHRFGPDTTLVIPAEVDHQIINRGTEPCVIAFVLIAAEPVTVGGRVLNAQG